MELLDRTMFYRSGSREISADSNLRSVCDWETSVRRTYRTWKLPFYGGGGLSYLRIESVNQFDIDCAAENLDLDKPVSAVTKSSLEETFNRLSNEWKAAIGPRSLVSSVVTHPAYLEIISYGDEMIPYILHDLKKQPNHWFVALYIMAKRFSPVKPEDVGNIKKMTEAWLEWGRRNGKLQ